MTRVEEPQQRNWKEPLSGHAETDVGKAMGQSQRTSPRRLLVTWNNFSTAPDGFALGYNSVNFLHPSVALISDLNCTYVCLKFINE